MATKDKKSATKKETTQTKVTRIKAVDTEPSIKKETKKAENAAEKQPKEKKETKNPLRAIGGYFAGAWYELKQVRWPNRRATWGMTAAMLAFTAFFVALILLLDALFKYLFDLILG